MIIYLISLHILKYLWFFLLLWGPLLRCSVLPCLCLRFTPGDTRNWVRFCHTWEKSEILTPVILVQHAKLEGRKLQDSVTYELPLASIIEIEILLNTLNIWVTEWIKLKDKIVILQVEESRKLYEGMRQKIIISVGR